jgi:Mrp family chromosome partitioning ATPase
LQAEGERRDVASELRDVGRVLGRNWWLVLLCVALSGGAAYAWSQLRDPVYESQSRVLLLQPTPNVAVGVGQTFVDPTRARATDLDLVRQPVIAQRVIEKLDLDTTPGGLTSDVSTSANGDSNVMTITVHGDTARRTAAVANAFADEFVEFRRQSDRRRYRRALTAVKKRLADLRSSGDATPSEIKQLRFQQRQLGLGASLQTGGSEVIQRAKGPGYDVSGADDTRNLVIAGIVGLLLGLVLAFLRDRLDPRLKTESDVRSAAPGIPILSTVPRSGRRRGWVTAEAFHSLKAAVDALSGDGGVTSLLVTGSMPDEGKSTTTVNLAAAMAGRNRHVTVVEADLRRPGLSKVLGVNGDPGVSTVLAGGDLDEAFGTAKVAPSRKRRGPSLFVPGEFGFVPAGPRAGSAAGRLDDDSMVAILDRAAQKSQTVIVDGPPAAMFGDVLGVARRVDGVLVAVRLRHTTRAALERLLDRLSIAGVRPMGIVLLGAGRSPAEYGRYAGG